MNLDKNITAQGVSLLLHVLRLQKIDTAKYLLEQGADPNLNSAPSPDQQGGHLVWSAAARIPCLNQREEVMLQLLERGILVNTCFLYSEAGSEGSPVAQLAADKAACEAEVLDESSSEGEQMPGQRRYDDDSEDEDGEVEEAEDPDDSEVEGGESPEA